MSLHLHHNIARRVKTRTTPIPAIALICCLLFYSAALAASPTLSLDDARHLLHRTGMGASAAELTRFIGKTRTQAVEEIIAGIRTKPSLPMPAWTSRPAPHHWAKGNLSQPEQRSFNGARDREIEALRVWWVRQMIETRSPQTERLVLMWQNHFATAYTGIDSRAISIARQHRLFRRHATGKLEHLLKLVIRDPALLNYLDNDKSRKQSPNENLARELLELFTLGEGNYSESDIKNAARALTGFSVEVLRDMNFRFKETLHDNTAKTVFGETGNFNGNDLIDLILQQPQTADFFARRFWKTFISDIPPTTAELEPLATTFRNSGYSLLTLYRATLMSEAFWSDKYRATIVKSPIELTIGTIRSTGIVPQHWQTLPSTLASMGQRLFDPPNVAGWPGGKHWITPSRLLTRLDWLKQFTLDCGTPNCSDVQANGSMMTNQMSDMAMNASAMQARTRKVPPMRRNAASATNPQAQNTISIRLASEDFDEAAQYQVSIYRTDERLWTTGPVAVTGGHDSNKLGRLKMNQSIPWQLVEFDVDADITDYDRIDIEFLNDAATNSADRNLFIDQVLYKGERYSAKNGHQESKCPPKRPEHAGRLYCNGTLMLYRVQSEPATVRTTHSLNSTFTADAVYVRPARSDHFSHLDFALTNVTLNDRQWHTVGFRVFNATDNNKDRKNNNRKQASDTAQPTYALMLHSFSCWPDCVEQWPECASKSRTEPDKRSLIFPVSGDWKKKQCHYQALNESDKALVNALRYNLQEIFKLAMANIPAKRQHILQSTSPWADTIEKVSAAYRQAHKNNNKNTPPELTLKPVNTPDPFVEADFISDSLLAGQLTRDQLLQSWNKLAATHSDTTLARVLLATPPLTDIDPLSLPELLSDLSSQLK